MSKTITPEQLTQFLEKAPCKAVSDPAPFFEYLCDRINAHFAPTPMVAAIEQNTKEIVETIESVWGPRPKAFLSCECGKRYFVAGQILVPIAD